MFKFFCVFFVFVVVVVVKVDGNIQQPTDVCMQVSLEFFLFVLFLRKKNNCIKNLINFIFTCNFYFRPRSGNSAWSFTNRISWPASKSPIPTSTQWIYNQYYKTYLLFFFVPRIL